MKWNEKLKSIFIYHSLSQNVEMNISFIIDGDSDRNDLEIELKTISKEYFNYCKAIDSGSLGQTNIKNGAGIFTGYSRSKYIVAIK